MTSYLIIDDEHLAHKIIKNYCDQLGNMQLKQHCYDAFEALDFFKTQAVDLIFLDLNMPKLKGFDFLKTLRNPPKVIVTTAYQEFALEGYELAISDYLLKPFSFERFVKAVHKATQPTVAIPTSVQPPTRSTPETIYLYSDKKYVQVTIADICYLEAAGNYTKVVSGEHTWVVRDKISSLLDQLSPTYFIQVHKSFVVAKAHITALEGNRITIADQVIPIGKRYKTLLLEYIKGV